MPATAADREMVLRAFGESKAARVETPSVVLPAVELTALVGTTWRKDAKSKEKKKEAESGVVDLASASDTSPKKAPEKKPEETSDNKAEYTKGAANIMQGIQGLSPLVKKLLLGGGIGAGIGGVRGALQPQGEPRLASALRGLVGGGAIGAGAGAGAHYLPKLMQHIGPGAGTAGEFAESLKIAPYAGGVAGAGVGAGAGRLLTGPRPVKKTSPEEAAAKKRPPQQRAAEETKKKPDEEEKQTKYGAAPQIAAKKPEPKEEPNKPPTDKPAAKPAAGGDLPVIGSIGGSVLGGLEKLLGGVGWEGGQQQMQEWGQSPTARNIAGGTTATLAAILTALAARKALKGGQEEEGLYAEAGMRLDLVKKSLMGTGAPAFKDPDGRNEQYGLPTRGSVTTTNRATTFDQLDKWSRGR